MTSVLHGRKQGFCHMAINRDFVKGWAQNELTSGEDHFACWIDPLEHSFLFFLIKKFNSKSFAHLQKPVAPSSC